MVPPKHPLQVVDELFQILGVRFLEKARSVSTFESLRSFFEESKKQAKENFKRMAFEHHPDRGGEEERFKVLSEAWNTLSKMELWQRMPQPVVTRIVIYSNQSMYTSSSTTTGGFYEW